MLNTKVVALMCALGLSMAGTVAAQEGGFAEGFRAAEHGDYQHAAQTFQHLARTGHVRAQFNLALMYHGGLGVERSEQEAVKWYHRAAENGAKKAQEFLAVAYQEGWFGLPEDPSQARYWFKKLNLSH